MNSLNASEEAGVATDTIEIGMTLYMARELLEHDVEQGLQFIAEQGFKYVELIALKDHPMVADPFFGLSGDHFHKLISDVGLVTLSAHCNPLGDFEAQLDTAVGWGIKHLIFPIAPAFMEFNNNGPRLKENIEPQDCYDLTVFLNTTGALCKDRGVQLSYHNHHGEFIANAGVLPYDLILEHTNPELVAMELDVGWVAKAGLNPAEVLNKNPGRFSLLHLKDIDRQLPHTGMGEEFVAPGEGDLDFDTILAAAQRAGVSCGFIECDHPSDARSSIVQSARQFRLQAEARQA